MSEPLVLLGMVGDLLVKRERPDEPFAVVKPTLQSCDVLFGNLESTFTDHPHAAPNVNLALFPERHNLDCFARAGFDVLALANNHACDAGHDALIETLDALHQQGVVTCGAGANLAEARKPAIVERNGIKIAFLGYASYFPAGYEARGHVPGLAPFRAHDAFRPAVENINCPGMAPRITSVPDERDVANLLEDIAKAKAQADVVVTSFHWGDWLKPYRVTAHEKTTARLAIDSGADMVIGHHHLTLRGMEWYKGKPILYGIGHFVFDLQIDAKGGKIVDDDSEEYNVGPREGWPFLSLHPDARMTMIAVAKLGKNGVAQVGYLPCQMRPDGSVVPHDAASPEGQQVANYMTKCNSTQRLAGSFILAEDLRLNGMRLMRLER